MKSNRMSKWISRRGLGNYYFFIQLCLTLCFLLASGSKNNLTAQLISSQCDPAVYIRRATAGATSGSGLLNSPGCTTNVSYNYTIIGGTTTSESFNCSSYDPTTWIRDGTLTVTFSQPVSNVGIYLWGLDATDQACFSADGTNANISFDPICACNPAGGATTPFPTITANCVNGPGGASWSEYLVLVSHPTNPDFTTITMPTNGSGGGFGFVGIGMAAGLCPISDACQNYADVNQITAGTYTSPQGVSITETNTGDAMLGGIAPGFYTCGTDPMPGLSGFPSTFLLGNNNNSGSYTFTFSQPVLSIELLTVGINVVGEGLFVSSNSGSLSISLDDGCSNVSGNSIIGDGNDYGGFGASGYNTITDDSGNGFTQLTVGFIQGETSGNGVSFVLTECMTLGASCVADAGSFVPLGACIPHTDRVIVTHNGDHEISNTQEYALTNEFGFILDIQSTPDFDPVPTGDYLVYAINYPTGGVDNLNIGTDIDILTGSCFDVSSVNVIVCPKEICAKYSSFQRL